MTCDCECLDGPICPRCDLREAESALGRVQIACDPDDTTPEPVLDAMPIMAEAMRRVRRAEQRLCVPTSALERAGDRAEDDPDTVYAQTGRVMSRRAIARAWRR